MFQSAPKESRCRHDDSATVITALRTDPGCSQKKRVLLVDTSHAKRDLRAEVLRKRGMYVDIAADIAEARSWWRPALYDLVLINMEKGKGLRDRFCDDVRSATPRSGWPSWLASLNIS